MSQQGDDTQRHSWTKPRTLVALYGDASPIFNESFVDPQFIALLRRYRIALVIADTGGKWPAPRDVTADFLYLRLHGATELYQSRYSDAMLARWARWIDLWRAGACPDDSEVVARGVELQSRARDVYCYFDNTDKVHAPANALRLLEMRSASAMDAAPAQPTGRNAVRRVDHEKAPR